MLLRRVTLIGILCSLVFGMAGPVEAGFAIRLEKEVPKSSVRGVNPITVSIFDSQGDATPVATQNFRGGELMISLLQTLSGAPMYRVRMDFTNTDALTMDRDLWWEFSLDGRKMGKRERVPQSAWSLFSLEPDISPHTSDPNAHHAPGGLISASRTSAFCDGTNNGVLWYDTTAGELRVCGKAGSIKAFSGGQVIDAVHVMFVTNAPFSGGSVGGLAGADDKCQTEGGSRFAGTFPGATWKALISTSTVNAKDRVTVSAPVYTWDDILIASNATDLWDGTVNTTLGSTAVWTGSEHSGLKASSNAFCTDWTSDSPGQGRVGMSTLAVAWMSWTDTSCTNSFGLYCISSAPLEFRHNP